MKFDVEGAKKAGYSDEEIQSFLAKETAGKSFDVEGAKKAGYSDQEIDDFLSRGKYVGKEGKLIGGKVGSALQAIAQQPSLPITEAPVAAGKFVESPLRAVEMLTEGAKKLFGSNFPTPHLQNTPLESLKNYVRSHLSPEQIEGAEDVSDIESFLIPFIKSKGSKGAPKTSGSVKGGPPPAEPPVGPSGGSTPFQERAALAPGETAPITEDLKAAGKAIKEKILGPNLSEEVPKTISPERFKNTTQAGVELENAIASTYKKLSAQEKKLYDISREANKGIEAIHPELVEHLDSFLNEAQKLPDPPLNVKRYIESIRKLDDALVERAPDGSIIGYKPISNQILINQAQAYNEIPKFEFPTDSKTGIFKILINKVTEAIDKTSAKFPEANKAWKEAKAAHSYKSELFDDKDVAKWIKLSDKNYSKDFLSSIEIDKIRKMSPTLKLSEEGRKVLQQMKRELVEKMLENNFSVGTRFDKKQIARQLAELEPVLTAEELKAVEALFQEAQTPGAKLLSLLDKTYRYMKKPSSALKEASKIE